MANHIKRSNPGTILKSCSNKTGWIILLVFLIQSIKTFSQDNVCESLVFEQGSSLLTRKLKDQLDQLCKKTLSTKRGRIGLTVFGKNDTESIRNTSMSEKRMRVVFAYLIAKNCGTLVSEIRIKPLQSDSLSGTIKQQPANQIECYILEAFPENNEYGSFTKDEYDLIKKVLPVLPPKPDTILQGPNGTLVRFPGNSFEPYNLSDFRYEIDEMFTKEEIGSYNMSTMTSAGAQIISFKAIRIWAIPLNPEIPFPVTLPVHATMLIPVDSARNDLKTDNMLVFRPATGNKSFITWNKSGDTIRLETYHGRKYFLVQNNVLGYLAIGKMNSTRMTAFLRIPQLKKFKITLKSDSSNLLVFYNDAYKSTIRLMPGTFCPDVVKNLYISAEGIDKHGNLFVLNQTPLSRFNDKTKKNCFLIRKKDLQRL